MNWNPKQTESDDTYAWIGAAVIFAVLGVVGAFLAGVLSASAAGALLALITTGVLALPACICKATLATVSMVARFSSKSPTPSQISKSQTNR